MAGKRRNYAVRKVHSHRFDHRPALSGSRAKRSSMPCMGTSCSDASESEQLSAVRRIDGRLPTTRAADRFYSAVVDETEEWAQVLIRCCLSLDCLHSVAAENFVGDLKEVFATYPES